jgi:exo-beta-1,3-glucanase (GH17 family)
LKPVEKKPESETPKHEPNPVGKKPESEAPKHEPKTVEKTPEVAPKPVEKTPEPAAKPPASKPHKSSHHVIGSSGSQWCMTYSPYNGDGTCKDKASVSSDIAAIAAKGFTSVRLYSTDCSGLLHVGAAVKSHGLKLVLGIYISNRGVADAEAQIKDIIDWTSGDWGRVEMIVVGNEALFNGYCAADALVDLIATAKAAFAKAGYSGPITTAEPINILKEHAASLCPVLDVVAANIHPFFNSDVTADTAGDFVAQELQHLQQICPGLDSYNLETGWPSAGSHNGAAVPGVSEQQAAIISIQKKAGSHSVFFSFVDDKWKDEGQFGV